MAPRRSKSDEKIDWKNGLLLLVLFAIVGAMGFSLGREHGRLEGPKVARIEISPYYTIITCHSWVKLTYSSDWVEYNDKGCGSTCARTDGSLGGCEYSEVYSYVCSDGKAGLILLLSSIERFYKTVDKK